MGTIVGVLVGLSVGGEDGIRVGPLGAVDGICVGLSEGIGVGRGGGK